MAEEQFDTIQDHSVDKKICQRSGIRKLGKRLSQSKNFPHENVVNVDKSIYPDFPPIFSLNKRRPIVRSYLRTVICPESLLNFLYA